MIDWLGQFGAKTAFIGGTGLHLDLPATTSRQYSEIGGLAQTTTLSHQGCVDQTELAGHPLLNCRGRVHAYETGSTAAMLPLYTALKQAGVEQVVISGAVGSMSAALPPGSLVCIQDHLFFGGASPLTGVANAFVDMTAAYEQDWADLPCATYAWTHGPQLETPAEISALQALGGQVVGMSMAPEVIIARYLGLRAYGLACVTNWAAGQGPVSTISEMLGHGKMASKRLPDILEPLIKST